VIADSAGQAVAFNLLLRFVYISGILSTDATASRCGSKVRPALIPDDEVIYMTDNHHGVRAPARVDAFDVLTYFETARTAVLRLAAAARLQAAEQARMLDHLDADRDEVLRAWRIANDVLGAVLNEVETTIGHLGRRAVQTARALDA
jgi:hypothetical protein